jgi:hypothetical protein
MIRARSILGWLVSLLCGFTLSIVFSCIACRPGPPVIRMFTAIPSELTAGESATLQWLVEEATTVTIDQGIGKVPLTGTTSVSPPKTLAYTITATNAGGTVTKSVVVYVNPPVPAQTSDTIPPVIKDITTSPQSDTQVTISWVTNEPSACKVEYGKSTEYVETATLNGLNTEHRITLDGLASNTIYHFRIIAQDEAGNESTSPDDVFHTPPPKSPFSLELQSLEWGREKEFEKMFEGQGYSELPGKTFIYVKGSAQNTSKATLYTVICTMHCWSGNKLVKSEVYVQQARLLPGHVFNFYIKTTDDPSVDNVTIEFADPQGRQIQVTQSRNLK